MLFFNNQSLVLTEAQTTPKMPALTVWFSYSPHYKVRRTEHTRYAKIADRPMTVQWPNTYPIKWFAIKQLPRKLSWNGIPKSRMISFTMNFSIPLLCSGWRNDKNSSSFNIRSGGGLSAWYHRSFRLSKTSCARNVRRRLKLSCSIHLKFLKYTFLWHSIV